MISPSTLANTRSKTHDSPATPRWARWSLLILVVGCAVLYSWNIGSSGYSDYYAAAAKSMSESWKAFFFGAFDPQSTITLDKLSGFLIPQALSARVFGFSQWSLALPQVIEGLITIVATFYIIRRWFGPLGGLIGATVMALTPLLVSMFSHTMEDGMLTMSTTLAIAAWQRCMDTDKRRYMLLAGAFIGLGFQAKMLQAWLVLPAMVVVYLVVAAFPLAHKIRVVLSLAAVTIVASFSWITAMALFPASQRPYVDGTLNNNIFTNVLGYNGVDRFIADGFPGALGSDPLGSPSGRIATVGLFPGALGHTPLKFLLPDYASQIGWLYPLAAAGLILGLLALRSGKTRPNPDTGLRAGVLLSTTLLITLGGVLSFMSLPHTAYLASMALPLSALCAIGVIFLWRSSRDRVSRLRFALPVTIAAETAWVLYLVSNYPRFSEWLTAPIGILGAAATLVMLARAAGWHRSGRAVRIAGVAAIIATVLAPLVWSISTLDRAYAGTANDAYAGPPTPSVISQNYLPDGPYGIGLDSNRDAKVTVDVEAEIYRYAVAHSGNRQFALLTDSWRSAAPLIMNGKQRILPLGGFTSRVPAPSLSALKAMVAGGQLRYFLLTGQASKNSLSTPNLNAVHQWVTQTCTLIPEKAYAPDKIGSAWNPATDQLYDCTATKPNS
jgi:4-amino-4-deoxy-L-arabinose transferase-like glycosyltransferase